MSSKKRAPKQTVNDGRRVILLWFLVLLAVFAAATGVMYWKDFLNNRDTIILGSWLFLFMVGGMFVQVLVSNHQAGWPMFEVPVHELLLLLLFSVVVYYPIWSVAASAPNSLFSFYAAFLNGYFWRNVLGSARPPGLKPPPQGLPHGGSKP